MKKRSPNWTKERLIQQLVAVCASLGRFPTQLECRDLGLSGFYAALCRNGGMREWWRKMKQLGFSHKATETEMGWNGENTVASILLQEGFDVTKPVSSKCYYDLLLDSILRIDVKSTSGSSHNGQAKAWYFRTGKLPTVDVVALFKVDLGDVIFVPWFMASSSNMSIGSTSEYDAFKNNFPMLREMIALRNREKDGLVKLMKQERAEYLSAVVRLRQSGKSYSNIGSMIGCAAQNVQKLLRQAKEYKKQGWL